MKHLVTFALVAIAFVLIGSTVFADGPSWKCQAEVERVKACDKFDMDFTVKDGRVQGTLFRGALRMGEIFSESRADSNKDISILVGLQTKFPGIVHISPEGELSGKVEFRCHAPLKVQGTCKKQ